jgi:hypothetical protein
MNTQSVVGNIFGKWTILSYSHKKSPHHYFHCGCACGSKRVVQFNSLRSGTSVSCGCHRSVTSARNLTKHGLSAHPAYRSWKAMHRRCKAARHYVGRISVCDRWGSFEAFWADMGATWEKGLSIDRIDGTKNYTPDNCRWATLEQQIINRSITVFIDTPWGKLPQSHAARMANISVGCLIHRMKAWPKSRWFEPAR